MISVLIGCTLIVSIASFYAAVLKRVLAETIILSTATVIAVLFLSAMLAFEGCLLIGIYIIIAMAVFSALYLLYIRIIKKRKIEIEFFRGCLILAFLLSISLFLNYKRVFIVFDEFSQWGIGAKHFFIMNALGNIGEKTLPYMRFLPGTTLFQYFFTRFSSTFIEWACYLGNNMIYFSLIMPLLKNIFKKKLIWADIAITALLLTIPMNLSMIWSELYADVLIGLLFGFVILYYYYYSYEKSSFGLLIVNAINFILSLVKERCIVFSLGLAALILIDIMICRRIEIKEYIKDKKNKIVAVLILSMPIIILAVSRFIWFLYCKFTGIDTMVIANRLTNTVFESFGETRITVFKNFINSMIYYKIPPVYATFLTISIFFLIFSILFSFRYRFIMRSGRTLVSAGVLFLGSYAYQLVLLISYIFIHNDFEGTYVMSYHRYTLHFVLCLAIFLLMYVITALQQEKRTAKEWMYDARILAKSAIGTFYSDKHVSYSHIRATIKFASDVLIICSCVYLLAISCYSLYPRVKERIAALPYLEFVRNSSAIVKWIPYFEDKSPYFIIQQDNGTEYLRLQYEIYPLDSANRGYDFSVGLEKYPLDGTAGLAKVENDLYTIILTPEEWQSYLMENNVELLYVFRKDDKFTDTYGHFFTDDVQNDMLYNVNITDGHMSFVPVTPEW